MNIKVNGELSQVPANATVGWLLVNLEVNEQAVAVARNGEVVPRSILSQCVLKPNDRVEIVRAVGGG
ncbi:MAG: sulfur carrier protein ThiS [Myxococcota bacterium]|nr:sulfur carrier protein ThiS [Myxococcota bacterium]